MPGPLNLWGVELEGGWDWDEIDEDGNSEEGENCHPDFHEDGSVSDIDSQYVGELSSPPLPLVDIKKYIIRNYPSAFNSSCGMHLHTSVNSVGDYSLLMDKRFTKLVRDRFTVWGQENVPNLHAFWNRLRGSNTYCEINQWDNPVSGLEYEADMQAKYHDRTGFRYKHLNFCYALHGTVEFRMLPMFPSSALAVKAVSLYASILRGWIRKTRIEEEIEKRDVFDVANDDVIINEVSECA